MGAFAQIAAAVLALALGPAAARIPSQARLVRISVERFHKPLRSPVVASGRQERRVAALVNQLPTFPPGVRACPVDLGVTVTLDFRAGAHGGLLAVAKADPYGCGQVALSVKGARPVVLSGGPGLIRSVSRLLGVTLIPPGRGLPAP